MPNQHIWTSNTGVGQQCMQLFVNLVAGSRPWTTITPGISRPIIATDAGEFSHLGLYQAPYQRSVSKTSIHHYCGTTFSQKRNVQAIASYIHKFAQRWIP